MTSSILFLAALFVCGCGTTTAEPTTAPSPAQLAEKAGPPRLKTAAGDIISTRLAVTPDEMAKGLSGVQSKDFGPSDGMLFVYEKPGLRTFWMPDTYFDLDIFYTDADLVVTAVERHLRAHPGRQTPPPIDRAAPHTAQYVLEMRADSPVAARIKVGQKLTLTRRLEL